MSAVLLSSDQTPDNLQALAKVSRLITSLSLSFGTVLFLQGFDKMMLFCFYKILCLFSFVFFLFEKEDVVVAHLSGVLSVTCFL